MASLLSRRLNPTYLLRNPDPVPNSLLAIFQSNSHFPTPTNPSPTIPPSYSSPTTTSSISLFPRPYFKPPNPNSICVKIPSFQSQTLALYPIIRCFSSAAPENSRSGDDPRAPPQEGLEFQHQEIVGPTVDRDLSALANETRQSLDSLRKSVYDLSSALALLGLAQLGLGAWIAYAAQPNGEVSVQGLAASAFPLSVAFLMRRALRPMSFFRKMEEQGRLQILTLALQVSKTLTLLILRTRVVSICCVVGISAGTAISLWTRKFE